MMGTVDVDDHKHPFLFKFLIDFQKSRIRTGERRGYMIVKRPVILKIPVNRPNIRHIRQIVNHNSPSNLFMQTSVLKYSYNILLSIILLQMSYMQESSQKVFKMHQKLQPIA